MAENDADLLRRIEQRIERIEQRVERIDDKGDAIVLKQQELAAYQKTANGNVAKITTDVIDLKGWRTQRELALARNAGVEEGRSDRVLTQAQWNVIKWALGIVTTGALAIIADVVRGIVFK